MQWLSCSLKAARHSWLTTTPFMLCRNIPPINAQHASIIGIPIPPPLNIAIVPQAGGGPGRVCRLVPVLAVHDTFKGL